MRVVRELTESRSKLVAGKCVMAEKFAELQQEYMKVRTHVKNNSGQLDGGVLSYSHMTAL